LLFLDCTQPQGIGYEVSVAELTAPELY